LSNDLPKTDCELVESIFHGNASVFKPHERNNTKERDPTILIVRNDETSQEISMSLQEPQTICGRAVVGTNQPNLFVRSLGPHEEPMTTEIRATRLEDISDLEILATHITSSSVHDLLSLDSSMSQVALALCNIRRTQQLWAMASMSEDSIHFGESSLGILARKTGAVVRLFQSAKMRARLRNNVNSTCYQDIPIRLEVHTGGTIDVFADPVSMVILPTSPPVICSTTPAMFRIMDDNQETWYSITDKGPQPCKNPHKLSPFTFIWNSIGMGLSWLALSIYDHKTVNSLHHFQNTDNIQGVRHRTTTISIIEDKEDQSFIKGVGNWGEETTNKVLKEIHPGAFSVLGTWTQHVIEIIFLIILAPVVLFLIVVVFRIIMMCIRRKLTLRAMTKGFKATLVNQNDRILASVHRQALISEEEQPEQDPMSNMSDSSEIIDNLVIKTRDLDDQIKVLATKLCTAERRIASLVTNHVALTASVTDATRNIGTSASYSNNVY